jgi:uncharacterized protein (TIGR00730 family)
MSKSTKTDAHTVCVYCGSSGAVREDYKTAAKEAGALLAARGANVVYGGGHVGLMGIVADAALTAGGHVTGIIPRHIEEREVSHTTLSELIVVDTMHARKTIMVERSDSFLILPGGFGTMDEFFEIITWRQLKLHSKPVVLANIGGFWDPLVALLEHQVREGFARAGDLSFVTVASTVQQAVDALLAPPVSHSHADTQLM